MSKQTLHCPHCGDGVLVNSLFPDEMKDMKNKKGYDLWDYDCNRCGRTWTKNEEYWVQGACADTAEIPVFILISE